MIDLRLGNVLDVLAQMPSESVHCIVTSPPYWGLRAYGTEPQVWRNGSEPCQDGHEWGELIPARGTSRWAHFEKDDGRTVKSDYTDTTATNHGDTCTRCGAWRGELGLEPTPELYVEHIVAVMREARRVLRADGTCWINLGDSYANTKVGNTNEAPDKKPRASLDAWHDMKFKKELPPGLKPKDLVGIPWRVAFALQADGWYLRSDIIWHKPNPMPESVRDRPTKSHEYLFLLAKQPRYYYDADAVRENLTESSIKRDKTPRGRRQNGGGSFESMTGIDYTTELGDMKCNPAGRNRRSVWTVTTHPYSGAHFATFPPKLIEPCILAATSERGCCPTCGAPWVRVVEKGGIVCRGGSANGARVENLTSVSLGETGTRNRSMNAGEFVQREHLTLGWRPSCACDAGEPVPATVLDPFNGAGTTGLVALQHGRNYIGIDLKQEYLDMTRERLDKAQIALAAT